jgi:hypothetical protein
MSIIGDVIDVLNKLPAWKGLPHLPSEGVPLKRS